MLDAVMKLASTASIPLLVLAVVGQWWLKSDRSRTRHLLLSGDLAFVLGLGINQLVLLVVQRSRPYVEGVTQLLVAPSADPSFPSDHATAAFAIAFTFLVYHARGRWAFVFAAMLISVSQIYIGTHYVSDIAGVALTALAAGLVVKLLFQQTNPLSRVVTKIL
jgi:undecaprenyl-diphosphatase